LIASKETMAVLFVIAAAGTWGLTGVLSKYLLGTTAPMMVALMQLSASLIVSWVIVAIRFEDVEVGGAFLGASALGVLYPGVSTILSIIGLAHLDASISSTLWSLEAAMTMILASLILAEKLRTIQIVLAIASVIGVFFAAMNGNQTRGLAENLYGAFLVLSAVVSCALHTVLSRHISSDPTAEPLPLVAGQQTVGLLVCLAIFPFHASAVRFGDLSAMSINIWLLCALSGILTFLVAMGLFLAALRHLSAGFASSFLILTPVFGLAASVLVLGEVLTNWQWTGIVIILISVLSLQFTNTHADQ
jgi:drug/metabolite transporter (DMT)-like permease